MFCRSAGVYMSVSSNIAKVESRGKIYFHYAETKRIYERQLKHSKKLRAKATSPQPHRSPPILTTITSQHVPPTNHLPSTQNGLKNLHIFTELHKNAIRCKKSRFLKPNPTNEDHPTLLSQSPLTQKLKTAVFNIKQRFFPKRQSRYQLQHFPIRSNEN